MQESSLLRFYRATKDIFNLRKDADESGTIENIRKNVDFHGANAWTLVFAIFIASIGLNMNSAAVVIGAMLISPLMGPILGIGLALGINDEALLRRSARNLSVAVLISVATSSVYFLLSPFHEAESELLARTSPTFYDVLIAVFGGAAGIVSISRKERGPSVAGVAIATALMPPLCTAGFAISGGNFKFLAGSLYLFMINSVFIALSTFLFVRYMKFKIVQPQEQDDQLKLRRWISAIVVTMIAPSIFFAWSLLQESRFKSRAEHFLREEFSGKSAFVVYSDLKYSYKKPVIQANLVGTPLTDQEIDDLKHKLPLYNLDGVTLQIRQIKPEDTKAIPAVSSFEIELSRLRQMQADKEQKSQLVAQMTDEAKTLFNNVDQVINLGSQLAVIWKKNPSRAEKKKISDFLLIRDKESKESPLHLSKLP